MGVSEYDVLIDEFISLEQGVTTSYYTHLEVVDDTFAIQKVVGDSKEVPVQCFAPWILAFQFIIAGFGIDESK